MRRALALVLVMVSCGDDTQPPMVDAPPIDRLPIDVPCFHCDGNFPMPDAAVDASATDALPPDAPPDAPMIDAPPPDAAPDAAGTCGIAADCAPGESCNTATHVCETACGGAHTACNGGCCDGNNCVAGTANNACGTSGGVCVTCSGRTPTCNGAGACITACGAAGNGTCGGGFCCSGGNCVDGTVMGHCGFSGTCTNCGTQAVGHRCIAPSGGPYVCGCESQTDCLAANPGVGLPGQACDTQAHTCTSQCGVTGITTVCNGGCCSGANGTCRVGNSASACGGGGGLCNNCAATCTPGPACLGGGICGCQGSNDCIAGAATCGTRLTCNAATNACE